MRAWNKGFACWRDLSTQLSSAQLSSAPLVRSVFSWHPASAPTTHRHAPTTFGSAARDDPLDSSSWLSDSQE